jgi:hypothetical protein
VQPQHFQNGENVMHTNAIDEVDQDRRMLLSAAMGVAATGSISPPHLLSNALPEARIAFKQLD